MLEVVLGIDNIIFISILAGKLPKQEQGRARTIGLMAAMVMRILLLISIAWIMRLTAPFFTIGGHPLSGRDLILLVGGLFLIFKATREIHDKLEGEDGHASGACGTVAGRRDRPDHGARYRVFARLGDHRRRHGGSRLDHDHRRRRRRRHHAVCVGADQPIRRSSIRR